MGRAGAARAALPGSPGGVIFRIPPLTVAHGYMLLLAVLFTALAFAGAPAAVLTLVLLAAWFGSVNFGALFQLASRLAAAESLGTLLGFVNFLGNLGAVAFTLLFGWSKDTLGSFTWGFALVPLAFMTLIAGWMTLTPLSPPGVPGSPRSIRATRGS